MRLKNCTKAELLQVIEALRRMSSGDMDAMIDIALSQIEAKRLKEKFSKSQHLLAQSNYALAEYRKLIAPYDGVDPADIPTDVVIRANQALIIAREKFMESTKMYE